MKSYKVKELMVPISDYATVSKGATLYEAFMALEKAHESFEGSSRYKHRAVLVLDENNQVIGKIGHHDTLRALEPQYAEMAPSGKTSHFGFSSDFLKSLREQYSLLDAPMENLCNKASNLKVEDFMYKPLDSEYIEADSSLDAAIHHIIMGHYQSLLVKDDEKIVGILRLTDIIELIFRGMKECTIAL